METGKSNVVRGVWKGRVIPPFPILVPWGKSPTKEQEEMIRLQELNEGSKDKSTLGKYLEYYPKDCYILLLPRHHLARVQLWVGEELAVSREDLSADDVLQVPIELLISNPSDNKKTSWQFKENLKVEITIIEKE